QQTQNEATRAIVGCGELLPLGARQREQRGLRSGEESGQEQQRTQQNEALSVRHTGNLTVTVVPLPGAESTRMSPSCAMMKLRAMVKPRPAPPCSRVGLESA